MIALTETPLTAVMKPTEKPPRVSQFVQKDVCFHLLMVSFSLRLIRLIWGLSKIILVIY